YIPQMEARGIANALYVCKEWAKGAALTVVLGDTIFVPDKTMDLYKPDWKPGARCFSYKVDNPYWCGCVKRENGKVVDLVEKPGEGWYGDEVLIGLYQYDVTVFGRISDLNPSARGELEITDLNRSYLASYELEVIPFQGKWFDAGTDLASYHQAWL